MGLDFITADPATDPFYKAQANANRQGEIQQGLGVDTAVRQGVGDMLAQKPAATLQPSYQAPPAAPPPPAAAAPQPGGLQATTVSAESGGNPSVVNKGGYSGKYQFGKASLIDAGVYQPASGENIAEQTKPWAGTFNVPGQGAMNYQQFLNNPSAQDAAWNSHVDAMDKEINRRHLDTYVGQTVGGVPITWDSLRSMIHGGGPSGTAAFLATGGAHNPADSNGTTVADFGKRVGAANGGAPPAAPAGQAYNNATQPDVSGNPTFAANWSQPNGSGFMPGANTSRYDPILNRLAQVPGGGKAALGLLENQGKFDQANYRRTDTYQRLAMSALAHGDTATARFYAEAGGMQLPDSVMNNQNNAVLLGRAATLAGKIYGNDPQQAVQFTRKYLETGNVDQAFTAAGAPSSNPNYKLEWARTEDGILHGLAFSGRTGTVAPVQVPGGGPQITSAPPPSNTVIQVPNAGGGTDPYNVNKNNGTAAPITGPGGAPISGAPKINPGSATLDHKIELLTSTGAMSRQDAIQAVTGVAVKPATVANAYRGFYASYANTLEGMKATEEQRQAAVSRQMETVFGPGWHAIMGQPGAQPQAPAAPQAAPTMAPAGAGDPSTYQVPATAPPAAPTQPATETPAPSSFTLPSSAAPQAGPANNDAAAAVASARLAIQKGAPRALVIQRLQAYGIQPPPDL